MTFDSILRSIEEMRAAIRLETDREKRRAMRATLQTLTEKAIHEAFRPAIGGV